jgi:hypothetical protein
LITTRYNAINFLNYIVAAFIIFIISQEAEV